MAPTFGLADALHYLREGDTIVVWRLDRFGRGLKDLIEKFAVLQEGRISIRSLKENIDTTTVGGEFIFHVSGALAEFERDLMRERIRAGLSAARARGRLGGRPRIVDEKKLTLLRSLHKDSSNSVRHICRTLGISRTTLYRYSGSGSSKK